MKIKHRYFLLCLSVFCLSAKGDLKRVQLILKEPRKVLYFQSGAALLKPYFYIELSEHALVTETNLGDVIGNVYLESLLETLQISGDQLRERLTELLNSERLDLYKKFIRKLSVNNYFLHRIGVFISIDSKIMSLVECLPSLEGSCNQTLSGIHQEYRELIILLLALLELHSDNFDSRYSIKVAIHFLKEIIDQFSDP